LPKYDDFCLEWAGRQGGPLARDRKRASVAVRERGARTKEALRAEMKRDGERDLFLVRTTETRARGIKFSVRRGHCVHYYYHYYHCYHHHNHYYYYYYYYSALPPTSWIAIEVALLPSSVRVRQPRRNTARIQPQGPWKEIEGLRDKLIRALLIRGIRLATDFQCRLLKFVHRKDNVIAVSRVFRRLNENNYLWSMDLSLKCYLSTFQINIVLFTLFRLVTITQHTL
jgi:hypothetical protein